jgi:hypothetical protein
VGGGWWPRLGSALERRKSPPDDNLGIFLCVRPAPIPEDAAGLARVLFDRLAGMATPHPARARPGRPRPTPRRARQAQDPSDGQNPGRHRCSHRRSGLARTLRRHRPPRTPRPSPDHQPTARRGRAARVRAPLQRSPSAPQPGAGCSLTATPRPRASQDQPDPTTRPPRSSTNISRSRTCARFRAPIASLHSQPV